LLGTSLPEEGSLNPAGGMSHTHTQLARLNNLAFHVDLHTQNYDEFRSIPAM